MFCCFICTFDAINSHGLYRNRYIYVFYVFVSSSYRVYEIRDTVFVVHTLDALRVL